MFFKELFLKGAYILESDPFIDERGVFERVYCKNELKSIGHTKDIVQINHSITKKKGAVRGMHFQRPPKAEVKIVRCLSGAIFDVIVDIRSESPTFLKWHGEILTSDNFKTLYIPEGFAHGFQALEDNSEIIYFNTEFYDKNYEAGLRFDDPALNIQWKYEAIEISQKDKSHDLIDKKFNGLVI